MDTPTNTNRPVRGVWYGTVLPVAGLLVLPVCYVAAGVFLRAGAGPFWQWNLLDPAYWYLLDSLNLITGAPPGHMLHPGVTVHAIGAAVIGLATWGGGAAESVKTVLDEPEHYLRLLSSAYLMIAALVLWGLGMAARRAFGSYLSALACQCAPFMSSLVLKHGFLPKPEALLVSVTLALTALSILMLRDGLSVSERRRYVIAFGIVAGFGLATKVTAAPIFVLPVLLFPNVRTAILYALVGLIAFGLFMLPGIGAIDLFIDWMAHVAMAAGPHGAGAQTIIDPDAYPAAVLKILKRPALKVPLILAALTGVVVWVRRRGGLALPMMEVRGLAAISAAQILQILLVAKQPTAFYLIPSYMLAAPSILLSARLIWASRSAGWRLPVSGSVIGMLILAGFTVAQFNAVLKLDRHFKNTKLAARSVDDARFKQCARVFIYAASDQSLAFYLADRVTGYRFSADFKRRFPPNNYWVDDWYDQTRFELRNWDGRQDFQKVVAAYPCVYLRGTRLDGFLKSEAPDMSFDRRCSAGIEAVATLNIDCREGMRK